MEKIRRQDYVYVGVDLHKEKHVAVMTDCFKEPIATFMTDNIPKKFSKFLSDIKKKSDNMPIIFGLEDVTFYGRTLAKFLLEEGQMVKHVNSAYTKRERFRSTSPDKTDSKDAEAICSSLIDNVNRLPDATPQDIYWVLKQQLALHEQLKKTETALKNSLQNQLIHHYPNYKKLFKDIGSKSALAFFEKFPSLDRVKGQTVERLVTYMKEKAFASFKVSTGEKILAQIKEDEWRASNLQEEQNEIICSYVRQLRNVQNEITTIEKNMDTLIDQTDYKLRTMQGISTVLAATIIADIGDIHAFSSSDKVAKMAGIAPLNHSSGNRNKQTRNLYGKRRLNKAFYLLALQHIAKDSKGNPRNPLMHQYYLKKQEEGRKPKQAMVYVMRKLVNIVYSMMKNKTEYIQPTSPELVAVGA